MLTYIEKEMIQLWLNWEYWEWEIILDYQCNHNSSFIKRKHKKVEVGEEEVRMEVDTKLMWLLALKAEEMDHELSKANGL